MKLNESEQEFQLFGKRQNCIVFRFTSSVYDPLEEHRIIHHAYSFTYRKLYFSKPDTKAYWL